MKKKIYIILVMGLIFLINSNITAQEPYRKGTTSANFLELGFGGAALGMGDSYVSMANDISSIYWNPAGLGYMTNNELMVMHQPWFADINSSFLGFGYVAPGLGTFGVGFTFISYGYFGIYDISRRNICIIFTYEHYSYFSRSLICYCYFNTYDF